MKDPTRSELLNAASTMCPEADEFDIECAIYWFANDWHGGQWSNLYSALSTSPFKPGPLAVSVQGDSDMASIIYDHFEASFAN